MKLNLDRFLPDEGLMRVRVRAGRSSMHPDEYAALRLIFSAHTSNNANFSQTISVRDVPVTASADAPGFVHFDIPLGDIQRNPFRKLTTTFPRRDEFLHIRNVSNAFLGAERMKVLVDHVEITAPYYEQWPPKSHANIFFDSPNRSDERAYGREVLDDPDHVALIAHEAAHQWWGNRVTCVGWEHFWLNEGFTVFLERKVSGEIYGQDFALVEAQLGNTSLWGDMVAFGLDTTYSSLHPVLKGDNPDNSFSEVPYEKGFQTLTYLESLVGADGI
jgi:hypothetical protein